MSENERDSGSVDPLIEAPTDEALEQQELRKKIEESVAEAQAHRSGEAVAEDEPETHAEAEGGEWRPPEEARMTAETGRLLVRLLLFAVLVFGVYLLVQQVIALYYAPELRSLGAVIPTERIAPGTAPRVGIKVRNEGQMDGAAFVVAAMADGQEFEGDFVTVPGNDTATAWVAVPFEPGDRIFSLILFDGWRDVERVTTLPGLKVEVGEHVVELDDVDLPRTVTAGDTVTVGFSAANSGEYPETLRPVVLLSPASGGRPLQFRGELIDIPSGESAALSVTVGTGSLQPGTYSAEVVVLTASDRRVAAMDAPSTMDVTE